MIAVTDYPKVQELYEQGWNDGQIGDELGYTSKEVLGYRRKNKLPANPFNKTKPHGKRWKHRYQY